MMIFDVKTFGAVANGKTFDTAAIQSAIDECFNNGGGKVVLENGIFLSSPIRLKSNIEFVIDKSATLLASPNTADYFDWDPKSADGFMPRDSSACFIFADEEENIKITGGGSIDGNGQAFVQEVANRRFAWKYERISKSTPPRVVFFTGCKNITVDNVVMKNTPSGWAYWINGCENIEFRNCKIFTNLEYPNNDGIHFNGSKNAIVENCDLRCGDDCIILRANSSPFKSKNIASENIIVRNCSLISYSSAIRIGWINDGTVKNCKLENITIDDSTTGISISLPDKISQERTSDEGREYSFVDNIVFKNISMKNIYARPILIRVGTPDGTLCKNISNIRFENINAEGIDFPYIAGKPNCDIGPITFVNCHFQKLPEKSFASPELHGAYIWSRYKDSEGLYVRHAALSFVDTAFTEKS